MSDSLVRHGVVAGFDGSSAARAAVRWAAAEAARRGCPLHLVRAYERPVEVTTLNWTPVGLRSRATRGTHCHNTVHALAAECQADHPGLAVVTAVRAGHPTEVLARYVEQTDAEMLVVGCATHGALSRFVLGSTAAHLVDAMSRPVVAVHALATDGPVLLGLDGSAGDDAAIEFAFTFAAQHDAPLHALHGGHHGTGETLAKQYDAGLLAPWHERYPKVAVTTEVLRDRPASALVSRSQTARLLVVGSHHHGTLHRVLTGSVSRTTLYHAACPVAVVPTEATVRAPVSSAAASPTR